jgi:biotin carboxyl carrier protein
MKLKITVHGVAYEVDVEVLDAKDEMGALPASPLPTAAAVPAPAPAGAAVPPQGPASAGPVAPGTVLQGRCKPGERVEAGRDLVVIEAMKMETVIAAPSAGTVRTVLVAAGDSVRENQVLVELD